MYTKLAYLATFKKIQLILLEELGLCFFFKGSRFSSGSSKSLVLESGFCVGSIKKLKLNLLGLTLQIEESTNSGCLPMLCG